MDINFPRIKIDKNELSLNVELFDNLYEKIIKTEKNIILLEDSYYNSFYDGEISLFWLFFKIYVGLKELKNNTLNDFECVHLIDNKNLTTMNKPHVIKFYHDCYVDFFSNLKKINPEYHKIILNNSLNSNRSKFIDCINYCGPGTNWKFEERNIEKLLSKSIDEDVNFSEKIFVANNISKYYPKFNNFYFINKNDKEKLNINKKNKIIDFRKEILKLNPQCNKIIIFNEVKNKEELKEYYQLVNDDEIATINKNNMLLFLLKMNYRYYTEFKEKPKDIEILKINSSVTFKNEGFNYNELKITNNSAVFLLEGLKKLYNNVELNDYVKKTKIRKTSNLIFKSIFTGNTKYKKLKSLYNEFYTNDYIVLEKIHKEIENLENSKNNIFTLENQIIEFINKYNVKDIFIGKSNFCLKNEDLVVLQEWIKFIIEEIKNIKCNISILNKNYPIGMPQNSLLIYLGQDNVSKYFKTKINCLNIKLDYNFDEKELEMISDFENINEKKFLIKSYNNSETLNNTKQILYFLENDFNVYSDNIQELYESGIESAFILTDFSQIKKYCESFIQSYSRNSKTRTIIKINTKTKIFKKNNEFNLNSKDYYEKISNVFILSLNDKEREIYTETIKNNIKSWIEKSTLPRNSILFLKFLKFINLEEDSKKLLMNHRYETSLNQSSGRELSKQIQRIFDKEWDDNEDYIKLVQDLKNSNLFKKYTIEITGE